MSHETRRHHRRHEEDGSDEIRGLWKRPWMRRSQEILTAQSISNNTVTPVTWDTDTASTDGADWFAASGDGIQILKDSMVAVTAELDLDAFDGTFWTSVNDTLAGGGHYMTHTQSATFAQTHTRPTMLHRWEAGTVISLDLRHASGSAKSLGGAYLEVVRIGSWEGPSPFDGDPDW